MTAPFQLLPSQVEPEGGLVWPCGEGRGRGSGKTFAGAFYTAGRLAAGLPALLIAENGYHLHECMLKPHGGLFDHMAAHGLTARRSETKPYLITFSNGAVAHLFSIRDDNPAVLHGREWGVIWGDELERGHKLPSNQMQDRVAEVLAFTAPYVRLGSWPRIILSGETLPRLPASLRP